MNLSTHSYGQRKGHRRRISMSKLSSDTVTTLPEYTSPPWTRRIDEVPLDSPPDYPESADEADADTEDDSGGPTQSISYVPQFAASPTSLNRPLSPRRRPVRRTYSHKRQAASTSNIDPYLDSLLERSVHALEMSNVLLQSTQSTQSSISAVFTSDSADDLTLEATARSLSRRIRNNRSTHESWMDDLVEISREVDGLHGKPKSRYSVQESLSKSLPTSNMSAHVRRPDQYHRPSLDLRKTVSSDTPALQYARPRRSEIISPPPRAITHYVESGDDPNVITLPSTLGLRASSSSYSSERGQSSEASGSTSELRLGLHSSPSLPVLIDRPSDPSTPAYNLLSSLVAHPPSIEPVTRSPSFNPLASFRPRRRGSTSTEASSQTSSTIAPMPRAAQASPERSLFEGRRSMSRSRSVTPTVCTSTPQLPPRPMTPPIEELSASSSSSSDHPTGYRTMQSLRKILDEQPPPPEDAVKSILPEPGRLRSPAFMPVSPAPVPVSDTSTATASISRLFTKGMHSSSTRPPSPPRHSALKQRSTPNTPLHTPSPSTQHFPDIFGFRSTSSSGRSTPKRISFAELPESYSGSRPGGTSSSRFSERRSKSRKGKDRDKVKSKNGEEGGWWTTWLLGGTLTPVKSDERLEERMATRAWSGRLAVGGGLDDWPL